jgi:hypothetical protein
MSTLLTFVTNANDCWGDNAGDFVGNANPLYLGHDNIGVGNTHRTHVWIPFIVTLPQGKKIEWAKINWYASGTRADDPVFVRIGCEDADNPLPPVSAGDVTGRVLTAAYIEYELVPYVAGTLYTYGCTGAVQEVLDRPGWVAGNTLAILVRNPYSDTSDNRRHVAAYEHTTYDPPFLQIYLTGFVPRIIVS